MKREKHMIRARIEELMGNDNSWMSDPKKVATIQAYGKALLEKDDDELPDTFKGRWTDEQVREMRKAYVDGDRVVDICKQYDITQTTFQRHVRTPELVKKRQKLKDKRKQRIEKKIRADILAGESRQYLQEIYGQNRVKQISIAMAKENGGQSVFDRRKYRGVTVDV